MNRQYTPQERWRKKEKNNRFFALLCCFLLLGTGVTYSFLVSRQSSATGITTLQCHGTQVPAQGAKLHNYVIEKHTIFRGKNAIGTLTMMLWYCFNYQSAYGRFTYVAKDGKTPLYGRCWLKNRTNVVKRKGCTDNLQSGKSVDTQITYGFQQTWHLEWQFSGNKNGTMRCGPALLSDVKSVYRSDLPTFCKTEGLLIKNTISPTPTPPSKRTPTSTNPPTTNFDVHTVEVDILNNIKAHGFNAQAPDPNNPGGTMSGLFINWRSGTNPLQTNVNGTGQTDDASGAKPRHDRLTDLRYLHNLLLYKAQNPTDTTFDSEIARYASIVQQEFGNHPDERGWTYDEFMDMYTLSQSIYRPADEVAFYQQMAMNTAQAFVQSFNSQVGTVFKKSQSHLQGSYRVDLSLEAGCALIEAGTTFHNQTWLNDGNATVKFIYAHAYIAKYHTFGSQMDNVQLSDGSVNPQETFFATSTQTKTETTGNLERMGNISQIIISLLNAYQATMNQDLLNKATDLLDQFSLPTNPLGMWDTTNGGYYNGIRFTGTTPGDISSFTVNTKTKEVGRQAIMLQAFHLANKFTHGRYDAMEKKMLDVSLHHIYNSSTHGVPYLVNADWTTPSFRNRTLNNMVTTEAMGAELESLFSL